MIRMSKIILIVLATLSAVGCGTKKGNAASLPETTATAATVPAKQSGFMKGAGKSYPNSERPFFKKVAQYDGAAKKGEKSYSMTLKVNRVVAGSGDTWHKKWSYAYSSYKPTLTYSILPIIQSVTVNSDHFILRIRFHDMTNDVIGKSKYREDPQFSFNGFTVGDLIPAKTTGYTAGDETKAPFKIIVPRQYKKLTFWGVNQFGNNYVFDLSPYDKYVKARTGRKGLDDKIKPIITLDYPSTQQGLYRTEEPYLTLEGRVTDNLGILHFKVNGEIVKRAENGRFKKRIRLKMGQNEVLLQATDVNHNKQVEDFVVVRDEVIEDQQFSDVDFPAETGKQNPDAVAVVFGIEQYRNAPGASFAVNDADIFREYLIKRFGFNRKNIYFRLDEMATKAEFDKVFSRNGWLSRHVNPQSDVMVFFSGHGAPDVESGIQYLVPFDADPNYASSTGVSVQSIVDGLNRLDVRSKTILLDACFSGSSRDQELLIADARASILREKLPDNALRMGSVSLFSASAVDEVSSAYREKKHGIFTYYLLKGLGGKADADGDQRITESEMALYLADRVSKTARRMGREQHPELTSLDQNRVLFRGPE